MRFKTLVELGALVLLFVGAWWFFTWADPVPETPKVLSIEQEEKIGKAIRDLFLLDYDILESEALDSAMCDIEDRLRGALDNHKYDYQIAVVESDEVNAFATMGGYIVVFSGLIELTEEPEELAAVIAHEMGHIEERHLSNRLVKEIGLAVLFSVAVGDHAILSDIYYQSVSSIFDRGQEADADYFALELMEKAGIDPIALANFFERLNEAELNYAKELEFLMTHPHNDKRIESAKNYETGEAFIEQAFNMDWERIKSQMSNEF